VPGEAVELDIELWPTSIVVPKGHRIALGVRGRDYEWQTSTGARLSNFKNELRGCGPFLHDDPRDRPRAVFGGRTTLHFGPGRAPHVLVPVIPAKEER
jgi:predicted acyl esterase